jgi:hypothetical protein
VFFVVASAILYLLYSALTRRTDTRAAVAGAVVGGEALVFVASGWRCPLTGVAERLGADDGSDVDIYLPHWIASHLPQVTIPLVATAAVLHARNLWGPARHGFRGAEGLRQATARHGQGAGLP